MAQLNVTLVVDDADLPALQAWFDVWNTKLTVPYADLADAARGESQHQVDNWVRAARPTLRQAYLEATEDEKAQIAAAVATITGKTISDG